MSPSLGRRWGKAGTWENDRLLPWPVPATYWNLPVSVDLPGEGSFVSPFPIFTLPILSHLPVRGGVSSTLLSRSNDTEHLPLLPFLKRSASSGSPSRMRSLQDVQRFLVSSGHLSASKFAKSLLLKFVKGCCYLSDTFSGPDRITVLSSPGPYRAGPCPPPPPPATCSPLLMAGRFSSHHFKSQVWEQHRGGSSQCPKNVSPVDEPGRARRPVAPCWVGVLVHPQEGQPFEGPSARLGLGQGSLPL